MPLLEREPCLEALSSWLDGASAGGGCVALNHHLACLERHLQNLDQDLAGMPDKANKLYLALYHAVELGSATNTVIDLTPDAVLRLRQAVAERLSHMLANHGLT